jgi:hypothetical protein
LNKVAPILETLNSEYAPQLLEGGSIEEKEVKNSFFLEGG